jgi:hypothetical protein
MYSDKKSYGLNEYLRRHGDSSNRYRTETFAQPRALVDGDTLSNGWQVSGNTFVGYNGKVGVNFTNGHSRLVASRLALQLAGNEGGILPERLRIGQILQTGCVVLGNPTRPNTVDEYTNQDEITIPLTGGRTGHNVNAPADLELAVFDEVYPPNIDRPLGAFALERVLSLDDSARIHLPSLF